ncbi:MAG: TonB-dependent receptor [Prolixibacteraceae bacterium]|nr:TonB-dependent receptor [Prolixibacteraceae bacterium]
MKLTIFLFVFCIVQTYAVSVFSQGTQLTLDIRNSKIEDVLSQIEKQSNFVFLYNRDIVDVNKVTDIKVEKASIENVLDKLFAGSSINYRIIDRQIVLSPEFAAQQRTISGKVTDSKRLPLPGVTVVEKGTTNGTITDSDGNYSLRNVPDNAILVFSFVGMKSQEVPAAGKQTVNLILEEETIGIEEVVAIGYGSAMKKDLTSSITSVTSENLNKAVTSNPILLLSGKVPGLNITKDGNPNSSSSIILRGPSTLRGGGAQQPLYVIDGIPGGIMPAVDDIVSIDVLKDASATAIYGSRAANGVIMVTTKKGEEGAFKVSYNAYTALETISNAYDVLSSDEYRNWISDMGLALDPVDDDGASTVWIDEITRLGFSHNNNLSLSGGNNRTTYIASVNYLGNEGIVKNTAQNRFVMRANVEQKMLNDRLKLGLTTYNSITDSKTVLEEAGNSSLFNTVYKYLPTVNIRNEDGTYREDYGAATYNPVALIEQNLGEHRSKSFMGTITAELNILKGLDYAVNASYSNGQSLGNSYMYQRSRLALNSNGLAIRNTYESESKLMETFASYKKTFGEHNVKLLGGYSWQESVSGNGFQTSSSNFVSNETLYYNLGMGNNYEGFIPDYGTTAITTLRMISGYARLNYDYKGKYLFQGTIRRDGSSAFGKNNQWGTFPSASVGWRILEEPFMQNQHIFDNLKLRAGYGISGNSIGFNPLISKLRFGQSGVSLYDGAFIKGIIPTQNENPDLKWEVTKMLNVGIDFSVFKGRLSGTIEYYEKNTEDLLWTYTVSSTEYYVPSYTANVGSMENKGYEVTLTAIPVQRKDFSWNSTLVLSHNKNLLTSLSNDRFQVEYIYLGAVGNHGQSGMNSQILQEGYPVGQFYTWKYAGPDENGQSQFYKEDGTLTTSPLTTDRHYAGNAQPKLIGGWHNTISYRNFTLDFLLRGVTGNKIMNVTLSNLNYPGEATHYNQHRMVLESSAIDINAPYTSTRYLEKGDYIRMDNITLMYSFKFSNPLIKGLKVYSTVNNAFIITDYRGSDPEINMGGITPGIDDDNYYPKTRSFIFGVNVDF